MTCVLEISSLQGAAAWCGKLFVRAGAEVVRAEAPGGPAPGRSAPERSPDLALHGGKLRAEQSLGDGNLRELASAADVVVTDASPDDVDRYRLAELPTPVVVSVTPFGLSGPYRDWEATESTLLALGGHTHLMGDPGRAPLTMPGRYPSWQAGTFAFVAASAALLAGGTARIEVSVLECLATLHQFTDVQWTVGGSVRSRHGNRWENLHPVTMLPCADGWFAVNVLEDFWLPFAFMLGRPDLAQDHSWTRNIERLRHADEVDGVILDVLGAKTKRDIFLDGQQTWRVPVGEVQTLQEVLDDPHLRERGFWQQVDGVKVPSAPYRIGGRTPAERAPSAAVPDWLLDPPRPRAPMASATTRPLDGIRVLELSHFWSAPLAGRLLADLGADVVKVEAPHARGTFPGWAQRHEYPQAIPVGRRPWNRQPLTNKLNRNKRSVAVDLKSPEGREAFLRLADRADVLIENFSARALPSLGLGHEVLRARNPRLVYVAMQGFGLTGPYREFVALGPSTEPMTGLTALMGYSPEEPRVTAKAILDPMSGMLGAAAVMDALLRRERTGQGALVEVSQHECGIAFVAEQLIERQLTGVEPDRIGNAHEACAPHGVYRCRGEDEWIAIAARDEDEWKALCEVAGSDWLTDPCFADAGERLARRNALDEAIDRWTRHHDKWELARSLQARGVPAGPVLSAPEWLSDAHLESRGYFSELADADCDPVRGDGLPLVVDGVRDYSGWRPGPTLGEHNREVLSDLAGLSDEEITALETAGVLATSPPESSL